MALPKKGARAKFDTFPPYVVRQTILHALSVGWQPRSGAGMRDLGNLDSKIDWSELRAES